MKNLINEINETAEKIDGIIKTLYETNNLICDYQNFKNDILKTIEKHKKAVAIETNENGESENASESKKQTEKQANNELLNENNGKSKQLSKEQKAELKKLVETLIIEKTSETNGKNYKVLLNSEQIKKFRALLVDSENITNNKLKSIICDSIIHALEKTSTETAEKSKQKVYGELKPNANKLLETINLSILRYGKLWDNETHSIVDQTRKPNTEN